QERKSARGNRFAFVQLSDPTGIYEVTVFSDTLEEARPLLEAGNAVVLTVEAEAQGDQVKLLARKVEAAEAVAARAGGAGLRIHVTDAGGLQSVKRRLMEAPAVPGLAPGPVTLVLSATDMSAEVELALADRYPITPQIRSAIKAAPGVLHIEEG
ncbi:MAG: OB-fold nucleic acid binding domain-containing protein, partial [Pseudomonadota bacterium]